jgi:zinc transporter
MTDSFISIFQIDETGAASLSTKDAKPADKGVHWTHLNFTKDDALSWLQNESGLDPIVVTAMTADETRPRCLTIDNGVLLILRGVNLNPGAEPEDMVASRVWIEPNRVISAERRQLMAVRDLISDCQNNNGPKSPGEFVYRLARNLANRMEPSIDNLDDEIDAMEETISQTQNYALRAQISHLRRRAVRLRRYIAPQREALMRLITDGESLLNTRLIHRTREIVERTTRYVEEIDEARDRCQILYDDVNSHLSENLNRNMYVLSVVAGIFLPLSLLTGLLGINVDGMPGSKDTPLAFWLVCGALGVIGIVELLIARKLRWL